MKKRIYAQRERREQHEAKQEERRVQAASEKKGKREEVLREACMIWMLVNGASDPNQAVLILAEAFDCSVAVINAKRKFYSAELERRTNDAHSDPQLARLVDARALSPGKLNLPWAKWPGSVGTELPKEPK